MMTFEGLTASHPLWERVKVYAAHCSWHAGEFLARHMSDCTFSDWERVIVALDGETICGYCTVAKDDCIPSVPYTPYIGFVFVGEAYRGKRLSQKMIQFSTDYLRSVGFHKVYLVSDHENLYEKYGFQVVDRQLAPWGSLEKIYMLSF